MASKRTKNRLYWLAVKSIALSARMNEGKPRETPSLRAYRDALSGKPDRILVPYVENLEEVYGPARLSDVSNADLWFARGIVDLIRDQYVYGGVR